ncbi:hypothetical protein [Pseudomonas protegens]|uniref:hypothetical protein n=1 Tax=Pseudomonas protegens TaxID=380021 RepID=UPI00383B8A78
MAHDDGAGGEFLVFPDWISLPVSIDRVYIKESVSGFAWYVSRLSVLFEKFGVAEFEFNFFNIV